MPLRTGLVIGPRGNTQKRLQMETGARIAVRGRGSEKEGAKAKFSEGQDDDLHVHICADTIEKVDKVGGLCNLCMQLAHSAWKAPPGW